MGDWNFYNIGATTLKALKGAKIIPDKDYEAYEGKKPDALIVKKPIIIAAIEYKTPQELRTESRLLKLLHKKLGQPRYCRQKFTLLLTARKLFGLTPLPVKKFYRKMVAALH